MSPFLHPDETNSSARIVLLIVSALALILSSTGCESMRTVRFGATYERGDESFTLWTQRPEEGPATPRRVDPVQGPNFGPQP